MKTKSLLLLLGGLFLVFLVGCADASVRDTESPRPSPTVAPPIPTPQPAEKSPPDSETYDTATLAAIQDLSERLGVDAGEIVVVRTEAVTWPDASLGCPEPGMAYIQILSPGYRLVLSVDGMEYVYHTDEGENAVHCEEQDNQNPSDDSAEIEAGLEPLVEQARAMLAQKLNIDPTQIEVLEARSIVWPDASLGCPEPDTFYIQVPKEGGLIRLSVLGTEYRYHVGEGRGLFLCESPSQP